MTHFLSIICIAIISLFNTHGQNLENTTLWEISGNGLEKKSYLFGTIHVTCDATLGVDVKKALDETSQVVLELDMDDPEMNKEVMQNISMNDGKTLKNYVTDEEYGIIDSLFTKHLGISIKMMETMKPIYLTSSLLPKLIDCEMQSFETKLINTAKEQGEEINGLETVEEQIKVFDSIPYKLQIEGIITMAKDDLNSEKEMLSKLIEIYNSKNITKLHDHMFNNSDNYLSKYEDIIVSNRNIKWIPKMVNYAKEQPTFFGVGAGHLAGKNGVIQLLRNEGYTITPVK
ncbi:TraB/GumN family protein [Kordia jejudonensis]|uniref:TraB/GumN family protein n=1 Tax=Kordia jejudonensis TaxID=1348245 RepID=UPI00062981AA|nr:TraB/GumN family protein [Kordia jejudonensis]